MSFWECSFGFQLHNFTMRNICTVLLFLVLGQGYAQSLIWTSYTSSTSGLIGDDIKSVCARSNGEVWVGHSSGINALVSNSWVSYNSFNVPIPSDNINAIEESATGQVWIGTDEGLVLFDGSTWTTYNSSNTPLVQNRIISIEISSNGDVWAVSEGGGLLRISSGNYSLFNASNSGFTGNNFLDVDTAPNGNVWAVGANGIYVFNGSTWSALDANNALLNQGVSCVEFDASGNAWLGTVSSGLIRYENLTYSLFQSGVSFLTSNSITDLKFSSDGTLWIGTSNGLNYYTVAQSGSYLSSNSGLSNNDILSLSVSSSGKLWIGTTLGLFTFCSSFVPVISSTNSQMCGTSQTTVMSVTAYSGYTYQWRLGSNPINNATNNSYTANAAGTYSVVTTNSLGCVATSASEIVTSNSPVSFINHPESFIGCPGVSATISCLAKGCGLAYRWQEETSPNIWVNLPTTGSVYSNVTTSVLTINSVTNAMNQKRFRCRIQGTYAPTLAFSNPMVLTVNTTPVLTLSNLPTPVCTPNTIDATTILVADANSSIGTISYWDASLNPVASPTQIDQSGIYYVRKTTTCGTIDQEQFVVTVYTSPILSALNPIPVCKPEFVDITAHEVLDANSTQGLFSYWSNALCTTAFNRPDSITTGAFVYLLKTTSEGCTDTLELYTTVGTHILKQPKNTNACIQGDAVFFVDARGIDLSYQWQEFNTVSNSWTTLANAGHYAGVNTNTLTVSILGDLSFDQRRYRCRISTSCANPIVNTIPKVITLLPDAVITSQPSEAIVCSGTEVIMTSSATGVDLKYRWQRKTPITPWTNLTNGTNFSDVTNDTLTINSAKASFSGHEFRMIALSECASDTSAEVKLYVNATILDQSLNANACTSDTAVFSVSVVGPGVTYQWQQQIGNGTFTNISNSSMFLDATTSVLRIAQPTEAMDGYNYRCKIFNNCTFPIYSVPKRLNVWSNAGPITVLTSPTDATVCSGLTTQLTCTASAPMTIRYQWQYFDVPQNKWLNISNNDTYSGAKTTTLSIVANNSLDNISYRCAVLANCPPLAISGTAVLNVNDCGLRSLSSNESSNYISDVYPNPASETININIKNTESTLVSVSITDMSGRVVYTSNVMANENYAHSIDCTEFSSGLYIVKVTSGEKLEEHKLTIQHH